jgi:hypothetical protein
MALAIIFMGVASPLFTRRMEMSTDNLLRQMERVQNASRPVPATAPAAALPAVASSHPVASPAAQKPSALKPISLKRAQP